jgi:hypothetical protein
MLSDKAVLQHIYKSLSSQGYSTTARTWLRPTLEAVGFWGGFSGELTQAELQDCSVCSTTDQVVYAGAHCSFLHYCAEKLRCSGEGIKTIVPARASVKLAARLVPDQSPDAVLDAIRRHACDIHIMLILSYSYVLLTSMCSGDADTSICCNWCIHTRVVSNAASSMTGMWSSSHRRSPM